MIDEPAPLPDRDVARRAWESLSKQTQAEVFVHAAHGNAHPDPVTAWTALAWARARRLRPQWKMRTLFAGLFVVGIVGAWLVRDLADDEYLRLILRAAFTGIALGATLRLAIPRFPGSGVAAVETANLRAAIAAGWFRLPVEVPARISVDRLSRALLVIGPLLVTGYVNANPGSEKGWWAPWLSALMYTLTFGGLVLVTIWSRPRAVLLDDYGLHLRRLVVPWHEIAWVEAHVIPEGGREHAGIRWQLKNPATFPATPRDRRRIYNAGGSVNVPFYWLTVPPEQAILTSRHQLARVPVPTR